MLLFARARAVFDAARMPDDERHLLRRAERGRAHQVALVLAVIIIDHHDNLAAAEPLYGLAYLLRHDFPHDVS
jgi:hypothetical protein